MLRRIKALVEELNGSEIRYCHWKSNAALLESLSGQTDIDLLVHRKDASLFRAMLNQHCFRPAVATDGESFPSMEHYYALDEESGIIVHVHAYFRVITGESLAKNYRFPLEDMLLQNTRTVDSVPVPTKSAELVVFTLRMMLKHTSLAELALLSRYWKQVYEETRWLLDGKPLDDTLDLLERWLPSLDTSLFRECVVALSTPAPLFRRIVLGRKLRSQIGLYARRSTLRAGMSSTHKFATMLFRRLANTRKGMVPGSGGAVIAFVGSEATGKSTLLAETRSWLGEHFAVRHIHAGKPRSTMFSFLPNLFVPALRRLVPFYRSGHIESQLAAMKPSKKRPTRYPLAFGIRSTLLGYDRRSLLTRAFIRAANGTIVLCDRYPSSQSGAPDSPQLAHFPPAAHGGSLRRRLAQTEARFYREIPPPDLIVYLSAPLELTLSRNAQRGKHEPEAFVRQRHATSSSLTFERTQVFELSTDRPFDQTFLEVKKAIWNAL